MVTAIVVSKDSNSRATHPTPTTNDVQLGRGGHNWSWAGNEQLRRFALGRVHDYATATKKQKALISWEVLQQVKETGGRFLEKIDCENNIWAEVSDKVAREKVCQVLRDAAKGENRSKKKRPLPTEDEKAARKRAPRKTYRYTCSADGCTNHVVKGGVCIRHGAKVEYKRCSVEGCTNQVIKGGVCIGAKVVYKRWQ